ncbi:purine-cytosine permease family protein [Paenarthrobacter nicotinovorans]|uniref:purine-cytosine permease family protein n=1 Tax=Paenarthrobacter nicotinovorans TaxID=29320 RepID=UPI003812F70F
MKQVRSSAIEARTIEHIPLNERHGKPRQMFVFWFGSSMTLGTMAAGFTSTSLYGLPWWAALPALLIGVLIGGIVLSLHAAQGPQTGIPQMLQTRAQFGSYGSLLVIIIVIFSFVGFTATNMVLGGQAIASITPISTPVGIIGIGVTATVAAAFGYTMIHRLAGVMSVAAGTTLLLAFIWMFGVVRLPSDTWVTGEFSFTGFLGTISLGTLWMISCAPFVSDYTRYLPKDTGVRVAFWATYAGSGLGAFLPMVLGAFLGSAVAGADVVAGLASLTGNISILVIVVFSIALVTQSAGLIYCATLSTLTVGQTLFSRWAPGATSRIVISVLTLAVSIVMALAGEAEFLTNFTNFILILLCVLIPWTAINLIDYYVIRHGEYDLVAIFERDGGQYGRINGPAVISYFIGIAVQIPLLATPMYTGPVAEAIGGVDLSWLVGLLLTSPVYVVLMRRYSRQNVTAATDASAGVSGPAPASNHFSKSTTHG